MHDYEDVEGFAKANRRRAKILAIVALGIFAIPLGWVGYSYYKRQQRIAKLHEENRAALELKPDEIESLKKQIADQRARIAAQREVWKTVVAPEALASIHPGSAPCRMHRFETSQDGFVQGDSIDANFFGSFWVTRVPPGAPMFLPYESDLVELAAVEKRLADGTADHGNVPVRFGLENVIAFIVVEKESAPRVTGTGGGTIGSFVPGQLIGRAYIYSATAHRITCAADVAVSNSESIRFDFSYMQGNYADKDYKMKQAGEVQLVRDFEANVTKTLGAQLRAVSAE